jgi:hypothetical protein
MGDSCFLDEMAVQDAGNSGILPAKMTDVQL